MKPNLKFLLLTITAILALSSTQSHADDLGLSYSLSSGDAGLTSAAGGSNSVYYQTGTYYFTDTDLRVAARSIPMAWDRSYRSNRILSPAVRDLEDSAGTGSNTADSSSSSQLVFAEPADGALGYGWTNVWLTRIVGDTYVNPDGHYISFKKDANGSYIPNLGEGLTLSKTAGGYELRETGGNTSTFNQSGKLIAIKDPAGNTVTVNYDAAGHLTTIKDVMGRQIFTFSSNGAGRIASVTDLADRTISYSYDPYGNLIRVHAAGITTAVYNYNANHGLFGRCNAIGETYTIGYYQKWQDKGIVSQIIDPVGTELLRQGEPLTGHVMTFSYDFVSNIFFYTEYSGATYRSVLNESGRIVYLDEYKDGVYIPVNKKEYLPNRITNSADALGNITGIQQDEWGNIIKKTDEEGSVWLSTYDSNKHLLSSTDPLKTITRYEYDAKGNKTKETQAAGTPDESITTWTYNQYNELTSETRNGSTTTYTRDTAGNITEIKDPAGNSSTMTYDAAGNLTGRTVPLIGFTTYENFDFRNNPGKVTDPNGNVITYSYDRLGRVLTATNQADGGVTQYSYATTNAGSCASCGGASSVGKIKSIILPEGNQISYDYDNAGNLTRIIDNDGNSINYSYDKKGNKIKEEINDGVGALQKYLDYQYDALNRQKRIVNPDNSFTETGYDKRGNRISLINPNGNATTYSYDQVNRLTKVTQPGNVATTYTYDKRNNLTSVTDDNGNTTSYEYDKQNRVIKTASPDTGISTYSYDSNGNLKTKTDAKNVTATYNYDAVNRLLNISFPDPVDNVIYAYDTCLNGKGRVCRLTDPSGVTTYEYTKKGQLAKETKTIDASTFTTEYTYDKNGNNTALKYPSGRVVTYQYSNDKIATILNNGTLIAASISYKPFGPITGLIYGNGIQQTNTYDNQYRITGITATGVQNLSYTYDKNGNITGIADTLDPTKTKSYGYDQLDRLATATGPWGSLGYTYDGVGN